MEDRELRWLEWGRRIQAIGQTGLHFTTIEYDRQRYQQLIEIASQIMAEYSQLPADRLEKSFLENNGYATPKVDVRGAVFQDGKILMVQESRDQKWCLPGGWADVGESPTSNVVREVWEESGFRVKARRLSGVYESNADLPPLTVYHAYKMVFLCEIIGGQATPSYETSAVQFFPLDSLPEFSGSRTKLRHIQDALACLNDPAHAPYFD